MTTTSIDSGGTNEVTVSTSGNRLELTKNRIYESMTRIKHYDCTVRVWCREDKFLPVPRYDIISRVKEIPKAYAFGDQAEVIAQVLDTFPDVSAYEILDDLGNGGIVYVDW